MKRRVWREWQHHRSPRLKNELKEYVKKLKNLLNSRKTVSLRKYLDNLDATADTDYSLWRAASNFKRPVISRLPLRQSNGDWARDDLEKTNLFVGNLKQVFTTNVADGFVELPSLVSGFTAASSIRFEMHDIERIISDLKLKKAPGVDKISNKMIMEFPYLAKRLIIFIINAVLRLEYYPRVWKISLFSKIPKPGKKTQLFDKVLIKKLRPLLSESECIPNHQFRTNS